MKAYYFPKLPLHVITLSSLPSHPEYLKDENINVKFNDWKQTYNEDILESISSKGQLDPNIGRWSGIEWVVEPGQSRWLALYKLGKTTQRILVRVEEKDEKYFHLLSKYEHREIKDMEEAAPLFKNTTIESHTGLGYLRRKDWFK